MQHIKEVSELVLKIKKALQVMNFNKEEYAESEVVFRLTSIRGMLIMTLNDSSEMLKKWKDEEQITRKSSGQERVGDIWTNEDESAEIERQIVEDACR